MADDGSMIVAGEADESDVDDEVAAISASEITVGVITQNYNLSLRPPRNEHNLLALRINSF